MRETRSAGFPIEVDRLGPRDDCLPVAVLVQIGQRGEEQLAAEAATAKVGGDAGGAEEAEAAVVRVVSREAGDLSLVLHREEGSAVRGLESPDGSECSVDEVQDALSIVSLCGADNLVCAGRQDCLPYTEHRHLYFQILRSRRLPIAMRSEEVQRRRV